MSKRQLICNSHLKLLNYLLPNLDLNKTAPVSWDQWMRIDEVHGRYYEEKFIHLPENNVTIGGISKVSSILKMSVKKYLKSVQILTLSC